MTAPAMDDDASTPILVAFARLEGKLDANLAAHAADLKANADDIRDHETRLRAQEARSTVSPGQLWAGLVGTLGAAAAVAAILRTIFPA